MFGARVSGSIQRLEREGANIRRNEKRERDTGGCPGEPLRSELLHDSIEPSKATRLATPPATKKSRSWENVLDNPKPNVVAPPNPEPGQVESPQAVL
jgi:hypothetical protein